MCVLIVQMDYPDHPFSGLVRNVASGPPSLLDGQTDTGYWFAVGLEITNYKHRSSGPLLC